MNTTSFIRRHSLPLILALISLLIALGGDEARQLLRYDRAMIDQGEVWRLYSGQLAHLGLSHLLLNLAGLALIWGLYRDALEIWQWVLVTLISAFVVALGLYSANPELDWYVGLSGLLHGLFVAGALGGVLRGDRREMILLAAIVAKLIWEQSMGALPGTAEMANGPVIVDAHLYGAIGGLVVLALTPKKSCDID